MKPLHPEDAAWYHMDGPANQAVVTGLVLTAKPLDAQRVRALLAQRVATLDRFRHRVVEAGLPLPSPHWAEVERFDIDHHVHVAAAPEPADDAQLARWLDELTSTPLPKDLPLWQVHLLDRGRHGGAMVMRYHHCIGDGMAMMNVAARLFDTSPRTRPRVDASQVTAAPPAGGSLLQPGFDAIDAASRAVAGVWNAAREAVVHPQAALEQAALLVRGAGVLVGELLKTPDPASPMKGEFGRDKRVAWSAPVSVAELKAAGAPLGAKLNDVLVAAVAGALRSYLGERGLPVDHRTLRAMVPVNLRRPDHLDRLGNEFGLVILDLPVSEPGLLRRLASAKARMDALKRSPEPVAMQVLMDLFGHGPKALQVLAQGLFGSKASVVLTNVAGPRQRLYLAGRPIERLLFWVPHPGEDLGMGLSLLSYAGHATLGVQADARLVPDPERIVQAFEHECAQLVARLHAGQERVAALRAPKHAKVGAAVRRHPALGQAGEPTKARARQGP